MKHSHNTDETWQQKKYAEVFEDVCESLTYQRRINPHFSIAELKKRLEDKYTHQGQNWIGKGVVAEITDAATIAAYEHILAEWQQEVSE
ncbi:hypothetical protein GF339_05275 [candidate division KSB3 bacterium]|jgi:hypothetical protein|uniref:Uncharacterized protein n=1 Tax=candidate division KSB3 bacterium TaxID=2044937 RepID=A0A9D5JTI9_9BACT|nr:hypothetical protein [candidate division KSB3 bacterium]MBD3323973.1 hypothetical protein [candidate division KSB3 bacterium]